MSFSSGANRGRRKRPVAEINVTPLVDVMLVLLVIFIITAPALKEGIDVELPKAKGGAGGGKAITGLTVSVDSTGRVHAGDKTLEPDRIEADLPPLLKGHEKETLTLRAHRALPYDRVVKVIAVIRRAGIKGISIALDASGPGGSSSEGSKKAPSE